MSPADSLILFWFTVVGSAGVFVLLAAWLDTWIKARKRRAQNARHLYEWVQSHVR